MLPEGHKKFVIRTRAIILCKGRLLVCRHTPEAIYVALPGGHVEWGEDPQEALVREIQEELGVTPSVGRLLYVHTYIRDSIHSIEFFFEVANGEEFLIERVGAASHAHEISELFWTKPGENVNLLPRPIVDDFYYGDLLHDRVHFIKQ